MTRSVCIRCGEIGSGILVPCRACKYVPETGWEIGVSTVFSDHNQDAHYLKAMSEEFKDWYASQSPKYLKFSKETESYIRAFLEDPDARDALTLHRSARDSIFRREINWHIVGPDGYESRVVRRGKDAPRTAFNAMKKLRGSDVFFVRFYDKGKKKEFEIGKVTWYAVRDYFILIDRDLTKMDICLGLITGRAKAFTADFLKAHGLDLEA